MVSTSGDNKKNILIALGAGIALVGAALIYNWVSNSDATEASDDPTDAIPEAAEIDSEEIEKKLAAAKLDQVNYNQSGQLDTNYFLKLMQFVGE